jgi:hypothetical protein
MAYEQFTMSCEATGLDKETLPQVMIAMMGPKRKTVILSSSMRKIIGEGTPGRYNYENPNLKALLDKAIPAGAGPHLQKHRTGACGEVNCVAVWEKLYAHRDTLDGSLIVSWGDTQ